jgi:DNA-binding MarR family transcriptional regulator
MKPPAKPMSAAVRDYRDHIPYLLGAIANILSAGGSRLYQEAFGISLAEWRLMWVLRHESPLTAARASEMIGVDKGAISRALSGLEHRGLVWIAAHPTDRRQRTIVLSEAGEALYGRISVLAHERERRLFSAFTADELRELRKLLRRLHGHAPGVDAIDIARFTRKANPASTAAENVKAANTPRQRSVPANKSAAR